MTAAIAVGLAVKGKGTSPFVEAQTANGTTNEQVSVTGVTAGNWKLIDQLFNKQLCFSMRQTESAYRYKDIIRKKDSFISIVLATKSSENDLLSALNRALLTIASWCSSVQLALSSLVVSTVFYVASHR
jgi:chromodomain protein Y